MKRSPTRWINNVVQIDNNGTVGNCPFCKSVDTDYMFYEHDNNRGFLQVWCNACKEQVHIDCGAIPHNRKYMNFKEAVKSGEGIKPVFEKTPTNVRALDDRPLSIERLTEMKESMEKLKEKMYEEECAELQAWFMQSYAEAAQQVAALPEVGGHDDRGEPIMRKVTQERNRRLNELKTKYGKMN